GVPKLPSGQIPPLYSANHASCFLFTEDERKDPIAFSRKFQPEYLQTKICKGEKHRNVEYRVIPRFMTSLEDMNLQKYPPYPKWESDYFRPQKIFQVPRMKQNPSVQNILNWSFLELPRMECRL
ncbi:hypothetical protein EBS02_11550, partial [bacterium]|nr:hypothetical protein [bacterium]